MRRIAPKDGKTGCCSEDHYRHGFAAWVRFDLIFSNTGFQLPKVGCL